MKIISFWGGPGVGKSTSAFGLIYEMKKRYLRVEYANEYAKDMTFERRANILADQVYILAKQNRIFQRHEGHGVDYVVADCALPLGLLYTPPEYYRSYQDLVMEIFSDYDTLNIYLARNPDIKYDHVGRNQNEDEAKGLDEAADRLLQRLHIPYTTLIAGDHVPLQVLKMIEEEKLITAWSSRHG